MEDKIQQKYIHINRHVYTSKESRKIILKSKKSDKYCSGYILVSREKFIFYELFKLKLLKLVCQCPYVYKIVKEEFLNMCFKNWISLVQNSVDNV